MADDNYLISISVNTTVWASSKQSFFTTPSSGDILTTRYNIMVGLHQLLITLPSMCCRNESLMLTLLMALSEMYVA